jgi:hypothetical protein
MPLPAHPPKFFLFSYISIIYFAHTKPSVYYLLFFVAFLHLVMNWKARKSMTFAVQLRYLLKVATAVAWVIILPVTYAYTLSNPTGFARTIKGWFGDGQSQPSLYIVAVLVYLSPHFLSAILFLIPHLRIRLESSNNRLFMVTMWWAQVIHLNFQASLCEIS